MNTAAQLKSNAKDLIKEQDWLGALAVLKDLNEVEQGKPSVSLLAMSARCLFKTGQLAEACDFAKLALDIRPSHAGSLRTLAQVAAANENWPSAVAGWRRVIDVSQEKDAVLLAEKSLCRALINLGRFDEAQEYIERFKQQDPTDPVAWLLQVKIGDLLKDHEITNESWAQVVKRAPSETLKSPAYLKYIGNQDAASAGRYVLEDLHTADAEDARTVLAYLFRRIPLAVYMNAFEQVTQRFPDRFEFRSRYLKQRVSHPASPAQVEENIADCRDFAARHPRSSTAFSLLLKSLISANDSQAVRKLIEDKEKATGPTLLGHSVRSWLAAAEGDYEASAHHAKNAQSMRYVLAEDTKGLDLRLQTHEPSKPFKNSVLLFASILNERLFAPWFLEYYRSLGVDWFFLVDNGSQDGTAEYLAQQKDVTLYASSDIFSRASSGMCWVNALIERHGHENWCIFVDADEQLIVPDAGNNGLRGFLDGMAAKGETALAAYMLDTYPSKLNVARDFVAGDDPSKVSAWIDPAHCFSGKMECTYLNVRGGARHRLFGTLEQLEKTPIIWGDPSRCYSNNHFINQAKPSTQAGVLLHHKILRDAIDSVSASEEAATRLSARPVGCKLRHGLYRSAKYLSEDSNGELSKGPGAFEFISQKQLQDHGLIGEVTKLKQSDVTETEIEYFTLKATTTLATPTRKNEPRSIQVNAQNAISEAKAAGKSADWLNAEKHWLAALEVVPEKQARPVYAGLANARLNLKKYRAAKKTVLRGLELFPNAPVLKDVLARIALWERDWETAEQLWRECLDRKPQGNGSWYVGLFEALENQNRLKEARDLLETGRSLLPDDADILKRLTLLALDEQNWELASCLGQTGIQLCESKGRARLTGQFALYQARALFHLYRRDEAISVLKAARKCFSANLSQIRREFVEVLCDARELDMLVEEYSTGLLSETMVPSDSRAARALVMSNRTRDAADIFTRSFDVRTTLPNYNEVLRLTAMIFRGQEKVDWYRRIYDRASEMLEKTERTKHNQKKRERLYEAKLGALYALEDVDAFDRVATDLYVETPEAAKRHLEMATRLKNAKDPGALKNKIFGIGLSKTGTTSLTKALEILGFSAAHYTNPYSQEFLSPRDIPLYDALTDTPVAYKFEELYEKFPDARFIYTTRPIDLWVPSFLKHLHRNLNMNAYGEFDEVVNGANLSRDGELFRDVHNKLYVQFETPEEAYRHHDAAVRKFFGDRPEAKFREINFFEGDGFPELASFLDCPVPDQSIPWENAAKDHRPLALRHEA